MAEHKLNRTKIIKSLNNHVGNKTEKQTNTPPTTPPAPTTNKTLPIGLMQ